MNLANRFNSLLHLCLVLSSLAFVTADEKPLLALIAAIAAGISWTLSRGRRVDKPPALPRTAINLLVLGAVANAAMHASGNTLDNPFVSTLGQFLIFIALIKMLDRHAPRDDAQLITLSVFIAIAAVLTSSTFVVGSLLILYVPTAVAAAMMWQLRAGQVMVADAARADALLAAPGAARPKSAPAEVRLPTGLHPRRGFLAVCFSSVIVAAVLATAVFVLVPRGLGSDFLGRFGVARQAQIGYRESVRLGASGFLSENATPVMDVRITTLSDQPMGGAGELVYLRGSARDHYNPGSAAWEDSSPLPGHAAQVEEVKAGYCWTPMLRSDPAESSAPDAAPLSSKLRRQRITMRGESAGGAMFCLWRPVSITPDRDVKIAFSAATGVVRHPDPSGPRLSYTVDSLPNNRLSDAPPSPEDFQDGRIRAFTDLLLKQRALERDKPDRSSRLVINAIRDHLRANCAYTTEMVSPPEGVDPIEFFLFDRQKGHCEYFASAMAAMCQSQGVPARMVTGYLASEFNSLTGQYLVRESNAHAWVEAFVTVEPETGRGRWETFEASPQGEIERIHRSSRGLMAWVRSWYDALEVGWSTSVVGFDNASSRGASRRELGDEASYSPRITAAADRLALWLRTIRSDPSQIPWFLRALPLIGVGAVGISIVLRRMGKGFGSTKLRGRIRAAHGLSPFKPAGFYGRALKSLARAGLPKPDHVPPIRFAEAIARQSPEAARHLRALSLAFYHARFGGHAPDAAAQALADDHARRMDQALRAWKHAQRTA